MAYSKSRDAYPRIVEIIVNGLAKRTNLPQEQRTEGDGVVKIEFDSDTEAGSIRYNLYGWIQLLLKTGSKEEMEVAQAAQRWKIAAEGKWVICKERDNPASLMKAMSQLIEAGLM
jgi:hypothetical protein